MGQSIRITMSVVYRVSRCSRLRKFKNLVIWPNFSILSGPMSALLQGKNPHTDPLFDTFCNRMSPRYTRAAD